VYDKDKYIWYFDMTDHSNSKMLSMAIIVDTFQLLAGLEHLGPEHGSRRNQVQGAVLLWSFFGFLCLLEQG